MRPSRKWLFRLIAVVCVPLLLLAFLEIALRLCGYGHGTAFFEKVSVGEKDYLVNNPDFSLRFFPPQLGRWPSPIMMPAKKPAGTFRIFVLGESAAMGDPEPSYGASRYMEKILEQRFPDAHFEVINLGITAINSNVILPIARACAEEQGDLWIIYMGNNEMVGPFGTATVFGAKAVPWPLIRLNLAVQKSRVGQLVMAVSRKLKGKSRNSSWGGMQMFLGNQVAPDDPRKQVVYDNFRKNLQDIVRIGLSSGAKIILSTVAVNLKDCPPFASIADKKESAEDQANFKKLYEEGCAAETESNFLQANRSFEQAARLQPQSPDVQYRWGECLLCQSNASAAREHLQLACDDDALPFRADSRINDLIRRIGRQNTGAGLELFDVIPALETNSSDGICGSETFYEHVHFNFDGNYRLGLAWAEQVAAQLPGPIKTYSAGGWASEEQCERLLGLSDWNRSLIFEHMMGRIKEPPFVGQSNNARRLEDLHSQVVRLHSQMDASEMSAAKENFQRQVEQAPDDFDLLENFAAFLQATGDLTGATVQWRRVHELIPQDAVALYELGRLLGGQKQWTEAETDLRAALKLRPSLTEGWIELGNVLASQEKYSEALDSYSVARQQRPRDSRTVFRIGKVYEMMKQPAAALQCYGEAGELNPGDWEAHFELGGALDSAGRLEEALKEFDDAARLNPGYSRTHFNYGVLLAKLGRLDEAQREFEETLRLEPENKGAQADLEKIRILKARERRN